MLIMDKYIMPLVVIILSFWLFFQPYDAENDSLISIITHIICLPCLIVFYPVWFVLNCRVVEHPLKGILSAWFIIQGFIVLVFTGFSSFLMILCSSDLLARTSGDMNAFFYIIPAYEALFALMALYFGFSKRESVMSRLLFRDKPETDEGIT